MKSIRSRHTPAQVEPLEQRIAPAAITPVLLNPTTIDPNELQAINVGSPILLSADPSMHAPQGLTLGPGGPVLLYVTKGTCLVFTNDLNGNKAFDYNEITGISAGDGLRLISFVDIHGDIVTNLRPDGTLTDSDNNAANGRDGQVLLNSKIESIQLRSITANDLPAGASLPDRYAQSTYSIFGNIYAGGGFGTKDGGLLIDDSGYTTFGTTPVKPQIGNIRVGSAASGRIFSFGFSNADDPGGQLQTFTPQAGTPGADIINIHAADPSMKFNLGTLQAGDGGFNGRGGDVVGVTVTGDTAGGYGLIAGNGGPGPTGQRGGNVQDWVDLGSITSEIVIKTGSGGQGLLGKGGDAGSLTFGSAPAIDTDNNPTTPPVVPASPTNFAARLSLTLGNGGSGLTGGGAGGSMPAGMFTVPEPDIPAPVKVVSTWHKPGDIGQTISVDDQFDANGNATLGNALPNTTPSGLSRPARYRLRRGRRQRYRLHEHSTRWQTV
jgi:hypothetical protein